MPEPQLQTVICDIDGTIANDDHRKHYLTGPKKDWDAFYGACYGDTPIEPVVGLVRVLFGSYRIAFCSGRRESCREDTVRWLRQNALMYNDLLLRADGDHTDDADLKRGMLHLLRLDGHDIAFVIEDRQKVVDMWRAEGLVCLQAAPGDF